MKKISTLLVAIFLVAGFSSCNLDPGSRQLGKWQIELLGPISQIEVNLNDVAAESRKDISDTIRMTELGFGTGSVFIPPLSGITSAPVAATYDFLYESATFESGTLLLTIYNNMPVSIKAGTELVLDSDTDVNIFSHVIATDIPAGGTYVMDNPEDADLAGVTLTSNVKLYVRNFGTGGGAVVVDAEDGVVVQFEVVEPKLVEAYVKGYIQIDGSDTTDFNLEGDQLPADEIVGDINIHVSNGMPYRFTFQAYLLDADYNKIDSLLSELDTVEACAVNTDGTLGAPSYEVLQIHLTKERGENMQRAKHVVGMMHIETMSALPPSGSIRIEQKDKLDVRFVADFVMTLNAKNP